MSRILRFLPATVLANLQQAGDVRIVAQHVLKRLTYTFGKVRGVHINGMTAAEAVTYHESAAKVLIGIAVFANARSCGSIESRSIHYRREAVASSTLTGNCNTSLGCRITSYQTTAITILHSTLFTQYANQRSSIIV